MIASEMLNPSDKKELFSHGIVKYSNDIILNYSGIIVYIVLFIKLCSTMQIH